MLWLGLTRLCLCKQEMVPSAVVGSNTFVFVYNRKRFRLLWLDLTRLCLCKQEMVPFAVVGSNTFVFV